MTKHQGTAKPASAAVALLLAAGCAGRSVSHEGAAGSSGDERNGSTGGSSTTGSAGRSTVPSQPKPGDPVLDWASVPCDETFAIPASSSSAAADFMTRTCAKSFCHGKNFVADLDLRPDAGFALRTKDVVAKHGSIPCQDDVTKNCIPPTCPAPGSVMLIDSNDPAASWMLAGASRDPRVGGTDGCGDYMPPSNGLTNQLQRDCLAAIVNAVAALP